MSSSQNGHRRFQVHCSEDVARDIYQLQQELPPAQRKIFSKAFRHVMQRLRTEPMELGEPLYRLPALKMQVRSVVTLYEAPHARCRMILLNNLAGTRSRALPKTACKRDTQAARDFVEALDLRPKDPNWSRKCCWADGRLRV